jgi:alcohol dehydrogenase (NADP+)
MAVKLASGLGAQVAVMSRASGREADALALGTDRLLVSADKDAMAKAESTFDRIIDTIPVRHDVSPYMPPLDIDGTLVIVGHLGQIDEPSTAPLILRRRRVAGSPIGGIAQTQELLDFCARKNILPDCEMIRMDQINEAFKGMERSDVRYRFVIDMASLKA